MAKRIIALVGMTGAGKSDVAAFFKENRLPVIRFGEQTEIGLLEKNLANTQENERLYRVAIRKELGMAAYAILSKPRIDEALLKYDNVIIDGLYSWDEYKYLKEKYQQVILISIVANRADRYERLSRRPVRPLQSKEAEQRDIAEIEELAKAGPIAIADYILENNGTLEELKAKTEALLKQLNINQS